MIKEKRTIPKLTWEVIGILSISYFIKAEIYFDIYNTKENPLDIVKYWYQPLAIMFIVGSYCCYQLSKYSLIKGFFWLCLSLSGNWILRFIYNYKNEHIQSEYIWGAIFLIGAIFISLKIDIVEVIAKWVTHKVNNIRQKINNK